MAFKSTKPIWHISPITRRILAVNVGALLILGFGLLYSGQYERELIRTEITSLEGEGKLLAAALAEGGVRETIDGDPILAEDLARHMLRKLTEGHGSRTLIFARTGALLLDTHQMQGPSGVVEIMPLDPPFTTLSFADKALFYAEKFLDFLPTRLRLPKYPETMGNTAQSYPHVLDAMNGQSIATAWRDSDGQVVITIPIPIQSLKNVLGVVLLIEQGDTIDQAVRTVQFMVIKLFLVALLVTLLLSIYLSETIARPLMRLADAADGVRRSLLLKDEIPDFSWRKDEIGTLSSAMRDMTYALAERIDAIGNFAADVAHEIKNPLASVKSAVETLPLVKDEAQRNKLLAILDQDVSRLNRLITDISNASRLDADISRAEKISLDMADLVKNVIAAEVSSRGVQGRVLLDVQSNQKFNLSGNAIQLAQVLRNLVDNALSFLSPDGTVRVHLFDEKGKICLTVENDGAPIPEANLETVFERFYTERPVAEKFGLHSGLGLSISRQIVRAHQGSIAATNIKSADGAYKGVRFTILLPKGG